ncbi:MAG: hypothetical protein Q4P66_07100 [Actinomycetaceae bacterium]|nr:hypothetical protein [Actinomycetaceae bacterium]
MSGKICVLTRLAWRECRTHWLRSLIIVVIVALPVTAGTIKQAVHTIDTSGVALADRKLGSYAQAVATFVEAAEICQDSTGIKWQVPGDITIEPEGEALVDQLKMQTRALKELAGDNRISPVVDGNDLAIEHDGHYATTNVSIAQWDVIGADQSGNTGHADNQVHTGKKHYTDGEGSIDIIEGRLPRQVSELTVSDLLAEQLSIGLGDHVTVSSTVLGVDTQLRIVGISDGKSLAHSADFPIMDQKVNAFLNGKIVTDKGGKNQCSPPAAPDKNSTNEPHQATAHMQKECISASDASNLAYTTTYIITGKQSVTWDDIKTANSVGVIVTSRSVMSNPPSPSEIDNCGWSESTAIKTFEVSPLDLLASSIMGAFVVAIIVFLIPVSLLFSRSMQRSGTLVQSVGATQREWSTVVIATQWALTMIGMILGFVTSLIAAYSYALVYGVALSGFPFELTGPAWLVIFVSVAVIVSAMIGQHQVNKHTLSKGITPQTPSKKIVTAARITTALFTITLIVSLAFDSVWMATIPLQLACLTIGVALFIPSWFARWDKWLNRSVTKTRNTPRRLAIKEVHRRRHRSVPAVVAIMITTIISLSIAVLTFSYSDTQRSWANATPPGAITIAARNERDALEPYRQGDDEKKLLERARTIAAQHISIRKVTPIYGVFTQAISREGLEAVIDKEALSPADADALLKSFPSVTASADEPYDVVSEAGVGIQAQSPSGNKTVATCPHIHNDGNYLSQNNPHDYSRFIGDISRYTPTTRNKEHVCALQEISVTTASVMWKGRTPDTVIDDSRLMAALGAHMPELAEKELKTALTTLSQGGALVGDPGLIENGKTTIVVRSDIDGNVTEVKKVTVPAAIFPVPLDIVGGVVISPQVAHGIGIKQFQIASLIERESPRWWWQGWAAEDHINKDVSTVMVSLNHISKFDAGSYLLAIGALVAVSIFVITMLVVLSGLEMRRNYQVMTAIGAPLSLRRTMSAWYAGLTAFYGVTWGIVCAGLVTVIFHGAEFIRYLYGGEAVLSWLQYDSPMPLIIVLALIVCIVPLCAAGIGALLAPFAFPRNITHRWDRHRGGATGGDTNGDGCDGYGSNGPGGPGHHGDDNGGKTQDTATCPDNTCVRSRMYMRR